MHSFLLIGLDPQHIDYTAPGVPSGRTSESLNAEVAEIRKRFSDQGDRCDLCTIQPDVSAEAPVTTQLARATYDCVLIGGGIRQPGNDKLFERIINSIHRLAPTAAIGFVDHPKEGLKTAARVLSEDFKRARLLSPSIALNNGERQ